MKVLFVCLAIFSIAFAAPVQIGTCYLRGTTNDPNIKGTVTFTRVNETTVRVQASVSGITTTGEHGMHIHQYGDLSAAAGSSAGGHYDPLGTDHHACPYETPRHLGDMGNWTVTAGRISEEKELDLIELTGNSSIIGRAVVLHGGPDNCVDQPSGGTAPRVAFCVIGVADPGAGNTNEALAPQENPVTTAICVLKPTAYTTTNAVAGTVVLKQASPNGPTTIIASITGLDGKPHGFHIHEFGDVSNANGTAAGAHYDPLGSEHGIPPFATRHVGDMGNIFHYVNPTDAAYNYTNDKISLTGDHSVLGHTIIVHSVADDCGQPYGNAGGRLAQCVIGVINPGTAEPTIPLDTPVTQDDAACTPSTADTNTNDDLSSLATSHAVSLALLALAVVLAAFF